ncbi:MAG TPA: NnrU family protein [Acidiphilium sp.]|nr:NnrU family protein [Acidiphilium sp.]HQU24450.1 NnrU family protein [Acidiphilium sp.]
MIGWIIPIALYGALWISFGLSHSFFAASPGRSWLTRMAGRRERLLYNAIALLHLMIVLALGVILFSAHAPFHLPRALHALMDGIALLGVLILYRAGRSYDLARFLGLTHSETIEPLAVTGMNQIVRHPLYLGLILLLLGLSATPLSLATTICVVIYILIGIRFEERKLLGLYGAAYRDYCRAVPMLIPRWTRSHNRS